MTWRNNFRLGTKFRAALDAAFQERVDDEIAHALDGPEWRFDSPIEAMFEIAFRIITDLQHDPTMAFECREQVQIRQHRVDLVVSLIDLDGGYAASLIVECDGRDHHHASWEQIEADRHRDAELTALGHTVLRFPGTQIYNDPCGCVETVIDRLWTILIQAKRRQA